MSTQAVAGVGTKFRRWGGLTNPNWVDIAEVNSIKGPGMTRGLIDVTSLDSLEGYKEFIGGFRDGGNVTLNMNFTRAGFILFKGDFDSNVVKNYEILLPDLEHTSLEFQGFVMECPLNIQPDDKITVEVTIKVSGPPVLNSGSGSGTGTL